MCGPMADFGICSSPGKPTDKNQQLLCLAMFSIEMDMVLDTFYKW